MRQAVIVNIGIPESEITKPVLDAGLEAVTRLNEQLLRAGKAPDFGAQIRMGHFWAPEPPGQESFDHAGTLAKRGNGDCDDWAPLHAATLRVTGVDPGAKAVVYRSGPNMWHAVTERSDGSFQDPSQTAGMKTRPGGRAAGIPAAVVGSMSVVGGDMDQPLIAIKDCSSGTCTMTWVARSDLPITNGPLARQGASIVVRKSAATPAKALAGSILGAAVLGAASRFTSKRHLDKLYALSGLLKGKSVRQVAGIVGEDAVKDAIKTLAEICPQILDELRAHRRAVEGGSRRVGNIFDGVYTDPYGAGTPPEGRASGDIWSGVYDGGVDPARYDWPAQPAPPVEDIRPAPPVERARPAPPRERPAPPRERPAPPRERPLPPREDAIEGIRRAVGRAVRGAPQGPDLSRLSPAQRAAHAQHRADMLAAIQTELEAKLVGNSLDDEDVDVAVRIGDIVGRGHHRKHKRKKHKQQQQQQSSDDGGGGDGGGGDDGGGGGGGGSPGAPGGGGGGGGGDDGGGDDGGGDDGGDSDVSGTDPGSRAAAAVRSWKRLQGASPNPGFHGRMTRDADGVAFDFAGHFNRVMGCIGEVEGPSSLVIAAASQRLLDPDLPQDTEDAVLIALKQDTDTAQLRSFGQSLLPHFPAAASVLFARAAKLDADSGNVYSGVSGFNFIRTFKTMAHDAVRVGPLAFVPGAGAAVILATGLVAAGHSKAGFVKDARRAFAKLNNNKVFHTITSTYGHLYNQANPAFFAGTLVAGAADDLLHGEKLGQALKEQGKKLSSYLTEKASYAAQAGGVPPSVVPMLKGAAALASGQKIPGGILGVAAQAIPGGAEALSQGAGAVSQMINEGASAVKDVANARAALPPAAQAVFDQGAVLALGKHLQDKGFHQAQDLIHSADGTLEKKVLNALDMVKPGAPGVSGDGVPEPPTTALARPAPPTSPARPSPPTVTPSTPAPPLFRIAHARLRQQLPADAAEQVKKALAEVVLHPELARLPSHELARRLRITEPVARVVYASISHEVPGAPIVHTHRVEALVGRPAPPVVLSSHPSRPWTKFYVPSAPAAPQSTELAKLEQERAEHEVRARAESERLRALHAHTVANAAIESERLRMAHEEHADRAHTEAVRIRDAHRRVA